MLMRQSSHGSFHLTVEQHCEQRVACYRKALSYFAIEQHRTPRTGVQRLKGSGYVGFSAGGSVQLCTQSIETNGDQTAAPTVYGRL